MGCLGYFEPLGVFSWCLSGVAALLIRSVGGAWRVNGIRRTVASLACVRVNRKGILSGSMEECSLEGNGWCEYGRRCGGEGEISCS